MSNSFDVSSGFSREKLHSAQLKQKNNQKLQEKQEQAFKQDPSATTGMQWSYTPAAHSSDKTERQNVKLQSFEIATPEMEDLAILSSTVSTKETSVKAKNPVKSILDFARVKTSSAALEEKYKEIYKNSKSHNLLLERFMSQVKMAGISSLLSLLGASAGRIEEIKNEARNEALKEIEIKLSQDYAYAKAMIEIMG